MLREIIAARENNTASHQFSNSQLTIRNMPPKESILRTMDATRQGETDQRNAGINTSKSVRDNLINYLA